MTMRELLETFANSPQFDVLSPIVAIMIGISTALAILTFVGREIMRAFDPDYLIGNDARKRKEQDEQEKPKRKLKNEELLADEFEGDGEIVYMPFEGEYRELRH